MRGGVLNVMSNFIVSLVVIINYGDLHWTIMKVITLILQNYFTEQLLFVLSES